ncbi:MAG: methyltransferase domain-containing protein [Methylococcales bacterium]|nr:methyltransferase domain-containing protein [Methylococcales bacterium]
MKRDFLFAYYQTPRGKLLKELEVAYLQRSMTVGCQQTVLQIGGLGFENEFIDCSLYQHFSVVDAKKLACQEAHLIQAKSYALPIQSNCVDLIIVPHLLEFDAARFQTFRELERVLKPEGVLIVLNFNPWSLSVRYQFLLDKKFSNSWHGHFISRSRLFDWLKVLNFEVVSKTEFYLNSTKTQNGAAALGFSSCTFTSNAYAIRAIKRRYNPIPMSLVQSLMPRLAVQNPLAAKVKHD